MLHPTAELLRTQHGMWEKEHSRWESDLERWHKEHQEMLGWLREIEEFIQRHEKLLAVHQQEFRSHEFTDAEHEFEIVGHPLSTEELARLEKLHQEESVHHARQRLRHERLKRCQHRVREPFCNLVEVIREEF